MFEFDIMSTISQSLLMIINLHTYIIIYFHIILAAVRIVQIIIYYYAHDVSRRRSKT